MDSNLVSVNIRKGKAYIPTLAKTDVGVYMHIDPVYTVDLEVESLTKTIELVLKAGNPRIPHPSMDEFKNLPHVILKAAKVGSWKKFAEGCTEYSIFWQSEGFELEFFKKDEKGRFITDISRTLKFPSGTNIREIVEVILEDVRSRPELLN